MSSQSRSESASMMGPTWPTHSRTGSTGSPLLTKAISMLRLASSAVMGLLLMAESDPVPCRRAQLVNIVDADAEEAPRHPSPPLPPAPRLIFDVVCLAQNLTAIVKLKVIMLAGSPQPADFPN